MKLWQCFTLGLLAGTALTLGATRLRAPATLASATTAPTTPANAAALPAAASATPSTFAADATTDLAAKIARLRRWAAGQDTTLSNDDRMTWLQEWAEKDPYGALDFVEQAPRFPNRSLGLAIPLGVICRTRPADWLRWIQTHLARLEDRTEVATSIIRALGEDAPAQALELAEAPDIPVNWRHFGPLIAKLATTQPPQALAAFLRVPSEVRGNLADDFVRAWAGHDATAALAWAESQRDQPYFGNCIRGLLQTAVEKAPASLGELLRRLQPSPEMLRNLPTHNPTVVEALAAYLPEGKRQLAFDYQARQQFVQHPEQMTALAQRYLSGEAQLGFLTGGFSSWLTSDRQSALAWMQTQSDPALLQRLNAQIMEEQFSDNPQARLAWLETQPNMQAQIQQTINQLAYEEPAAAAAWLSSHSASSTPPEQQVEMIMTNYLRQDEAAAATWLAGLPPGTLRDQALQAAATLWAGKNEVAFATDSVNSIAEPARKTATQFAVFRTLRARNAAHAQQWATAQGLSADIIANWQAITFQASDDEPVELAPFEID